jgi:hypothetical protein
MTVYEVAGMITVPQSAVKSERIVQHCLCIGAALNACSYKHVHVHMNTYNMAPDIPLYY